MDMFDDIHDNLREQTKRERERQRQNEEQEQLAEDYLKVDRKALAKMPDKELAEWQGRYPPSCPQFILAEYEWQRRLTVEQVKASRFATVVGALAGIGGAIIGSLMTWLISK